MGAGHSVARVRTGDHAEERIANGTIREFDGQNRIYFDGYWIRYYDVPNTLAYKKDLIDSLARRVFHHAEPGINTPGNRLNDVRAAYETETDPAQKRVRAAMMAGALLNRGTDILTHMVELEQIGVNVRPDNELLKECGRCFMGALEYGRYIRPITGKEGLDELWGEPFKAFTMSVEKFHETRYLKISMTMQAIDRIRDRLIQMFQHVPGFAPVMPMLHELADSARLSTETMRSDVEIIDVWPRFVAAQDCLNAFDCEIAEGTDRREVTLVRRGLELVREGGALIAHLANLRVPMPRTTREFLERCDAFAERFQLHTRAAV